MDHSRLGPEVFVEGTRTVIHSFSLKPGHHPEILYPVPSFPLIFAERAGHRQAHRYFQS